MHRCTSILDISISQLVFLLFNSGKDLKKQLELEWEQSPAVVEARRDSNEWLQLQLK